MWDIYLHGNMKSKDSKQVVLNEFNRDKQIQQGQSRSPEDGLGDEEEDC